MISRSHADAIRPYVKGKVVHDFGAGNLALSLRLLELGASEVIAVDKEASKTRPQRDGLTFVKSLFQNYREPSDVAVASWPINHPVDLHRLVEQSRLVIYIGKNTDGTVCGYPAFWEHLVRREVLDCVPTRRQTLIIYGPGRVRRSPLPEEFAAVNLDQIWTYEDLHPRFGTWQPEPLA